MLYLSSTMHQRPFLPRVLNALSAPRSAARAAIAAGVALLLMWDARPIGSHEIPPRVTAVVWVQQGDWGVRVLVRVPLEAMRDLDFPVRPDSMLDLEAVRTLLPEAARLWIANSLDLRASAGPVAEGQVVATRISLPGDRAFDSVTTAVAHLGAPPLGNDIAIRWQQALLDVEIVYPSYARDARLSLLPTLAHLGIRTNTVLRLVLPNGTERLYLYTGDPGRVELNPSRSHAALLFVQQGVRHILGGLDHLLFVLCLVLPVRRWRSLIAIVTAFTLAHSLTLAAAALDLVPTAAWFPAFVETAIALSIIWLAIENVLFSEARLARRWRMAFGLGLIHGFGFSFALSEQLQFAGGHLLTALAAFNIGVELGQILVLAIALGALVLLYRVVEIERAHLITWIGSALIAHAAYHWAVERGVTLAAYRDSFAWPALDATFVLGVVQIVLLASVALAVGLMFRNVLDRFHFE